MAKININLTAPKTQDGTQVDLNANRSGGNNSAFDIIEPGFYNVLVQQLQTLKEKDSVYFTRNGEDSFLKLRPHFRVMNDNNTIISRQDFTVGYYNEEDGLYSKQADRSPVWGAIGGARSLLTALGMFREIGEGKFELDFDTDLVVNRVVRARIGIAGYVKGNYALTDSVRYPRDFDIVMSELAGRVTGLNEWTLESLATLVPAFNELHNLPEDDGLKTKNVLIGFYGVADWEAKENGWHVDGDNVFLTEKDYQEYLIAKEDLDSDGADW